MRLIDADAFKEWMIENSINDRELEESKQIGIWIDAFPSAETECTCCEYRVGDLCCYSDVKTDMEAMEEGEGE